MRPPLRLMLWYWGRRGGGPRYTFELAQALKQLPDVEPHLSISRQCAIAGEFRALGLPTLWVDTFTDVRSSLLRSLCLPQLIWRMRRYVREQHIDVVNSTMPHLWTRPVVPVLRHAGSRVLCTIHDATLHPGESTPMRRWLYTPAPSADGYIALTNFVARRLGDVYAIAPDRIAVIPHGALPFGKAEVPPRSCGDRPQRLLFFGRILPYKGLEILLAAYRILRAEGLPFTLQIAGSGELGAMTETIATLPDVAIDQRWIPDDHIPVLLSEADVVVLPYLEASQSGVVPAAFAMGVPAVVTPIGGLTEQVTANINGLVTRDTSPESLARELRRLATEPDLLRTLQAGCIRTANNEMDWLSIGRQIVQLSTKFQ